MSGGVLVLPALEELEELLRPTFLEQAHERASYCLHLRGRYLRDLAITEDKATSDLLKLKIAGDIGVDKYLGELAGCDDELGDEIDSVIPVATQLRRRLLVRPELAVKLRERV